MTSMLFVQRDFNFKAWSSLKRIHLLNLFMFKIDFRAQTCLNRNFSFFYAFALNRISPKRNCFIIKITIANPIVVHRKKYCLSWMYRRRNKFTHPISKVLQCKQCSRVCNMCQNVKSIRSPVIFPLLDLI